MTDTTTTVDEGDDTIPEKVGDVIEAAFGAGGIGDSDGTGKKLAKPKKGTVLAGEPLGEYAGLPELALGMSLTKVGDGLSTSMTVTGLRHQKGDRVIVITEAEIRGFKHEGIKDVDGWRVVEVLDGVRSAIVPLEDTKAVGLLKLLDRQDKDNAKAEEAAAGVQTLELGDDI